MTAQDLRAQLDRLVIERRHALTTGLRDNDFHMEELERELTAAHDAYVGFAVTEIAVLRSWVSGPLQG
jgi:hypothetical protein